MILIPLLLDNLKPWSFTQKQDEVLLFDLGLLVNLSFGDEEDDKEHNKNLPDDNKSSKSAPVYRDITMGDVGPNKIRHDKEYFQK